MKHCPYCGAEYPDDASMCSIDGHPLQEDVPEPPPISEQVKKASEKTAYLTFPDYQWSARDAWKCLGIILVFQFLLDFLIAMVELRFPSFFNWRASGFGYFPLTFCIML